MRKFFFAMAVLILSVIQAGAQDKSTRLTMTFQNESLPSVFIRLEKSSAYKFLFTYDDVQNYKVNGTVKNAKFLEIVDFVLKNKPLSYKVDGKFITVTLRDSKQKSNKQLSYGGYVKDQHGDPVIGAQVKVLGTQILTVTDLDGAYSFPYYMSGDMKIQVSYIGMKTVTLPLRQDMQITLVEDTKELSGVVVTGIFNKAKESYTGAVTTIGNEKLEMFRGSNLLQTLKNADVSLNFAIDNINGSDPNNLPNIIMRGNSSLPTSVEEYNQSASNAANTPLIIVDGFEISLTKLMDYNDDEIESINIMKDASATAIYGSRGANGVIVVTTKRPEVGRLKVQAEVGLQIEAPDLSSYNLLNAAEKLELERTVGLYDAASAVYQLKRQQAYADKLALVNSGVNTDWIAKPVHTGVGQNYKLRVEGGANEFRWGVSLSYNNITGAMKGSERDNFNGGITLMYNKKNIAIRNYTSIGINKSINSPYGQFSTYTKMQPYYSPYDAEGNIIKYLPNFYMSSNDELNPLFDASLNSKDETGYQEIANNFAIDWTIIEGLILRGQFGISSNIGTSDKFLPAAHSAFAKYTGDDIMRKGSYTKGDSHTNNIDGTITLSYNKLFADKHLLYVGLNYEIFSSNYENNLYGAEGFFSENQNNIGNAVQYTNGGKPSSVSTKSHRIGFTGNANYTYDNRYFVDLSYRIDGSSEYGSEKKYSPFWSAGLGWNLHNEGFIRDLNIFSYLRLKASYGETGSALSSNSGAFTSFNYDTSNRYFYWTGAIINGLGNPNLTWQTTKQTNVGLEFGVLNDRIRGEFNYYNKTTNNLLSFMDTPLSLGVNQYAANIGEVKNSGWEAMLSGYVIRNSEKKLNWMLSTQLTYNKNEISKLSDAIKQQNEKYMAEGADISTLFFEGYPQSGIYAVKSLGINPATGQEVYVKRDGSLTNKWDASDKTYCGQSDPKYRGMFSSLLQWKGWQLNLAFSYYWGGQMYNSTLLDKVEVTKLDIMAGNVDDRVLNDRWFNPGDNTFYSKITYDDKPKATSRYVFDYSMFSLSSASLQYRLTSHWLRKAGLTSVTFGANASDLFYISTVKQERGTSYPYARNIQGYMKLIF